MATLVLDPNVEERIKAEREASGADRFDEVWEGVYHVSPLANDEHQGLVGRLTWLLVDLIECHELGLVRPGVNVSDREDDWKFNYCIPDVAVFLRDTTARYCDTHWVGGPDFAVEICSPRDETRDKLPFYGRVGTRELLLVDRDPWALELYQLQGDQLVLAGASRLGAPEALVSAILPLTFRLVPAAGRPRIEVRHHDGIQSWLV
jgi:Uma2 family endonuclease